MRLPPFQTLLDRHRDDLYRLCVAAAGRQDADDVFQEAVLAALRAYPRLRSAENLRAWLMTVAHSKAMDSHRAARRRPVPVPALPERAAPGAPETDPAIWAAVRALPEKQRGAVLLRTVGDCSYAEIGRALGCSEEAARRSAHEGIKRLRKEWR